METKQTAVEWLNSNLIHAPYTQEDFTYNYKVFEQAKAMEKEQIKSAVDYGAERFGDISEQYYNETYGTDQSI